MATILPENQNNQELNSSVHQFFREQKLGTLLNQSNIRKEAGISPVLLVQFIFSLVLQKKNLYRILEKISVSLRQLLKKFRLKEF